jgi:hypothetical protein
LKSILTSDHLAKLIDNCIEDLEDGGPKLWDLAQVLHCTGEATGEPVYHALVPIIGSFASEIIAVRPIAFLPILPEPTRNRLQRIFNASIEGAKKSLTILKTELCKEDPIDAVKVLEAISILGKHDYELGMARSTLMKPTSPVGREE